MAYIPPHKRTTKIIDDNKLHCFIKPEHSSTVRFALDDTVYLVSRLDKEDIMGKDGIDNWYNFGFDRFLKCGANPYSLEFKYCLKWEELCEELLRKSE